MKNSTYLKRQTPFHIYSIEGNIGSGKSTFLNYMKQYYNKQHHIVFIQEPVEEWKTITDEYGHNIIEQFYKYPDEYAFSFQIMTLATRIHNIRNTIEENPKASIFITERCLHTDYNVFCKMLYEQHKINHIKFNIYKKLFYQFIELLPIYGYIYIYTEPEQAKERIIKRHRSGEENITLEYLKQCHEKHQSWLNTIPNKCVIDNKKQLHIYDNYIDNLKQIDIFIHTQNKIKPSYSYNFDSIRELSIYS